MEYVVISDLHIASSENPLAIFSAQENLANFLRSLGTDPVTLIINGDFVDFLALADSTTFDRTSAQIKANIIIEDTANQRHLWPGFRDFLALNTRNRIDILLGNHDLELIFDEVQAAFQAAMTESGEAERIRFRTESVSYAGLEIGHVPVRIEHGFQFDPYNYYNFADLLRTTSDGQSGADFTLPYGSRFVYQVLNELTPAHPFIPLLKPEPGVFWIMLALDLDGVKRLLDGGVGLQANRIINRFRMWLRGTQFPTSFAPTDRNSGLAGLDGQLLNPMEFSSLQANQREDIKELFNLNTGPGAAFGSLSTHLRHGELTLLRQKLEKLQIDRDTFFDPTNVVGDDFRRGYEEIIRQGYKVAILGHSHARKLKRYHLLPDETASLLYANTGTWAEMLDFDLTKLQTDESVENWLRRLSSRQIAPLPIYTAVRLSEISDGCGVRVTLEEWDGARLRLVQPAETVLPD